MILRFLLIVAFSASGSFSPVFAANAMVPSPLPQDFAGWNLVHSAQVSRDASMADPVNADILKEFGFTDVTNAVYTRDDGRKLKVKAARFTDASGAYGAFTFYKTQQMAIEKIGDQGASLDQRVIFYRGNILVDAEFDRLTMMSASELRELAAAIPAPAGNIAKLPALPTYLPAKNYVKNTAKYVTGPATLEKVGTPIDTKLVDFNAGAEVVVGEYTTGSGTATLILIAYPTPQIAASHLRAIDSFLQSRGQTPDSPAMFDRGTGPIVELVTGSASPSEAKSLLSLVNYEADVTWNQNTYFSRKDNPGNLIVNIIYLCAIIGAFAVISGVAFGGIRILLKRMFPDRLLGRWEQMQFTSLNLSEATHPNLRDDVSDSIKAS